ncbi:MAG: hypothetical protein DRQ88_11055 [Epsilonproteobacteria bacterium]|nr:MAG: hypothetical protein DRQ89_05910 [Campylobacterota bacterium]RLA64395.1 MAG: hypothetical protein DRQ88_11055 [Campylobacterota bacterium]
MISKHFPQTEKILGTKLFSELTSHFHSKDYGAFPQYLKENLPDIGTRYSFIPELSRLEYTIYTGQTHYEKFIPTLDTLRPLQIIEDSSKISLSLSPNIRLFKSWFPVWEIWQESTNADETPDLINLDLQPKVKKPYFYIINQSDKGPNAYPVKKSIYHLIEGILRGNSFSSVAAKLYAHKEPIVLTKALNKIQSLRLIDNYQIDQR